MAQAWSTAPAPSIEERVRTHAPLVRRIALHLAARLPAGVELDDLLQSGMLGLLEAAQNFSEGHGASFETFAGHRIRGAILDELRRGDWAPRSVHRGARDLHRARQRLEQSLGRSPSASEMAAELDLELHEYQHLADDAALTGLVSLDEGEDEDGVSSALRSLISPLQGPYSAVEHAELRQRLAEAIRTLPERDQLVLSLYYQEELHQKEIGQVLGVTESRVCQLHARALKALRAALDEDSRPIPPSPPRAARRSSAPEVRL
ncbi:MAG: RNA polymerase sigma factor FliA [Oceanococcaceae bacterium]